MTWVLIVTLWLQFLITYQQSSTICYTVNCETLPNKWAEKNDLGTRKLLLKPLNSNLLYFWNVRNLNYFIDSTIIISDQWGELELCDVNENYSGVCRAINYYIDLKSLYPGDKCSYPSWIEQCKYGTQNCVDGHCESVGHNGQCAESRDWPSHQYCAGATAGANGQCSQFKSIGEQCDHVYECGRTATCWFKNTK